jgi:adhesin/invasin
MRIYAVSERVVIPLAVLFLALVSSCGHEDVNAPTGASLVLSANPLSIPADGHSTAEIRAIVQDSTGQSLNGVVVYFSTTLGSITERAEVDNGIARATLTAGEQEGTASVMAISGTLSDSISITIGFQEINIFLTANPPEIPADGVSTSEIQAYVTEVKGIVPDGTEVAFTTTLGSITSPTTTEEGIARATLTAGVIEGDATITAIVRNDAESTTVAVGIPVANIVLSVNPSIFEVETAEPQTHVSDVRVTVWNAAGVPIENKSVIITSDQGQLDSGGSVQKTDENGQVTDVFRITIAVPQGSSQSARVTATSGEISATATVTIINTGG